MHATDSATSPPSDGQQPTQQEIDHIVRLYESGEHVLMEQAARALLDIYPGSALGWQVLGMALQLQGKDAMHALQKRVDLAPADAEAYLHLGNAHMDAGQPDLAMPCFIRALELAPGFAEALSRLGDVLQAQGHLKEAGECYRGALEIEPALAMAHAGKGDILMAQKKFQPAEASYRQALKLAPAATELYRKLGDAQLALNRPDAAMQNYTLALQHDDGNAMAHGGLGQVLFMLERHAQAAQSYGAATALPAASAAHYHGLGRSLHALGQTAEAESAYRQAIALDATIAAPMLHYADLLRETRRPEQAIAIYQAALLLDPHNIDTLNNLGIALQESGQLDQALASFRQVQQLAPDNPITHSNIAAVLNAMGRRDAALESCRRAVQLGPKSAPAHANLATFLMEIGSLSDAVKSFETVIRLDPHHRKAHVNISATLTRLGRIDQAIVHARQALKINPDWDELHSNLLFYLTHSGNVSATELFAEHVRYADQFEAPLRASWPRHANTRDPERMLRIGFVSADLYNHAMAHFITPIMEHLSRSPRFELVVYANSFHDDHVSRHLHGLVNIWRQVEKLTHAELAQLIASDSIDILIDLSGHTGFNRLPSFACKPAPVQLSWMGYPGTTGLQAIDYYPTDRFFSPPGMLDSQFTEKFIYLPAGAPFLPSPEAPPVSPSPALQNGHLTFGSFNRAEKLNRELIARWSRLLHAVPDARMCIAGMPNDQTSDKLRSWFAHDGIKSTRLSFHLRTNLQAYLALHAQVDVCLDTYPYSSGTTGFHALWMGVPTLTIPGSTQPGYAAAAILSHAGLPDFIAQDEAAFLAAGQRLAGDVERLATLRMEMRERLSTSDVGQSDGIASAFEAALRTMWTRWCLNLPVTSFTAEAAPSSTHQSGKE